MANTHGKLAKGTAVTIINEGLHFFPLGATVIIEGDHDTKDAIYAYGMTKFGIPSQQLIKATDFVVEGEAK